MLRLLLFTYVFGGLTFIPLVLAGILAFFFYTAPQVDEARLIEKQEEESKEKQISTGDGAASGTFAVLRQYDFQGSQQAFREAALAPNQTDANGDPVENREGVSVYQSMYRSVFVRGNGANPLQDSEQPQQARGRAKARGKVFYIVLRHGHLMLYDSQTQVEVRHVISLAHYTISLQDDLGDASGIIEAELYAKRTAIVLTALPSKQMNGAAPRKPFYLYCNVNIEKEDFYHALLSSLNDPPIPRPFDPECAIKLQSSLHSSSLSPETRAIDALLGRIFLALHRTPFMENFVKKKIEKKIARIQKPAFIASIACHNLSLGDAAPIISNVKLVSLNLSGETVISLDMKYLGGINLTMAAVAKLDLGQRFKTRMVSLLLAVVLQRLQGKMLVKIKPSPSNRIWFCFESMPDMELKIEPVVSSRQITYAFVLRAIETRIREAFAEGMVKPNWDDTPFFHTDEQHWRGGIWESEGREAEEAKTDEVAIHKSMSTPALASNELQDDARSVMSTGANSPDPENIRRRATAAPTTQGAQTAADKAWGISPRAPKSVRSPSFASPKPSVALDDASADAVKLDDTATTRRRWIGRNTQQQNQKRDAAEVVRQLRDKDELGRSQEMIDSFDTADLEDDVTTNITPDEMSDIDSLRRGSESSTQTLGSNKFNSHTMPRLSGRRDQGSFDSSHSRNLSTDSTNPQRKTILATTGAAAAAAKNWTWNAMANRANRQQMFNRNAVQRQGSHTSDESSAPESAAKAGEPIGRGQPLPPPGTPLPGPARKGLWSAAAAGIDGMRRKPIPALPPRRPSAVPDGDTVALQKHNVNAEDGIKDDASSQHDSSRTHSDHTNTAQDDDTTDDQVAAHDAASFEEAEFGPWNENVANEGDNDPLGVITTPASPIKKKVPPPLPKRRRPAHEEEEKAVDIPITTKLHADGEAETKTAHIKPHISDDHLKLQTENAHDLISEETEAGLQSPTPPDLIDFESHTEHESHGSHEQEHEMTHLEDDVEAIAAPVDPEAEETGILDMAEHIEPPKEIVDDAVKTAAKHDHDEAIHPSIETKPLKDSI